MTRSHPAALLLTAAALALAAATPAAGSAFALFEQAGRGAGLAGAFTAQADDPSAVFYNPGGLALLGKEPVATAGFAHHTLNESLYQGLGDQAGTTAEQDSWSRQLIHAFVVTAIGERAKAGIGLYSPYVLETRWASADAYPGRFEAVRARIHTWDFNASVGFQLGAGVGAGIGIVVRSAELRLQRRDTAELEFASLQYDTALEQGYGLTAGVLQRTAGGLSWGLAYQSAIDVDFEGTGTFTQIPTGDDVLDRLLESARPFGQDLGVTTTVGFPAVSTIGVAVPLGATTRVEVDAQEFGWSSLDAVALRFPGNPEFDETFEQRWEDAMTYRVGVRVATASGSELRFGTAFSESPQPTATAGPLFADGDRTTVAFGYGKDWLDLAFAWTDVAGREVLDNVDGIDGNYSSSLWTLTISISQ